MSDEQEAAPEAHPGPNPQVLVQHMTAYLTQVLTHHTRAEVEAAFPLALAAAPAPKG